MAAGAALDQFAPVQAPHPAMAPRDWAGLAVLSVLWGGSFFLVGVAVREWPPPSIVLARVAVAALALWAVVAALRLPVRRDGAALRAALGMGALNNLVPFGLIAWAQNGGLPSGLASILNASTPLWAVTAGCSKGESGWRPTRGLPCGDAPPKLFLLRNTRLDSVLHKPREQNER